MEHQNTQIIKRTSVSVVSLEPVPGCAATAAQQLPLASLSSHTFSPSRPSPSFSASLSLGKVGQHELVRVRAPRSQHRHSGAVQRRVGAKRDRAETECRSSSC